ncbi:alpha/beta fold hydrolase [Streptomyces sp. YGL11-2]|uniref:alpha/beta fold hydrolase n=1 Tax=Streptomyces sp. YGL11-2 TaxID=3414028 RepID=UPI003CF8BD0E
MDFAARELTDLVRPLVVDVRGRGLSDGAAPGPGGGGGYGPAAYAEDTEAVIAALAPGRPVLFGHSTGARIAAVVAARGKAATGGSVPADPPIRRSAAPAAGRTPPSLDTFFRTADAGRARYGCR